MSHCMINVSKSTMVSWCYTNIYWKNVQHDVLFFLKQKSNDYFSLLLRQHIDYDCKSVQYMTAIYYLIIIHIYEPRNIEHLLNLEVQWIPTFCGLVFCEFPLFLFFFFLFFLERNSKISWRKVAHLQLFSQILERKCNVMCILKSTGGALLVIRS